MRFVRISVRGCLHCFSENDNAVRRLLLNKMFTMNLTVIDNLNIVTYYGACYGYSE